MSKPRCEYAAHPSAILGPCSADPCTCCDDRTGHSFGAATHYIPYYFSARAKPVRRDRDLYLCPVHAKAWVHLHPFGPPALELTP